MIEGIIGQINMPYLSNVRIKHVWFQSNGKHIDSQMLGVVQKILIILLLLWVPLYIC